MEILGGVNYKMDKKLIIGIFIVIFFAVGFFVVNQEDQMEKTDCDGEFCELKDIKEFNVEAFRFGYTPEVITVKKGDRVKLSIDNSDGLHGIRIPELELSGMDSIEFTAEEEGEFTWRCNNYCGQGHSKMSGKIIVE